MHGHEVGDQVLIEVADLLKQHIRGCDILARWGGEEFVIIFPETPLEKAAEKAEYLRQRIAEANPKNHAKITCSFGVSEFKTGDTADALFSRADKALYRAKSNERNNVQTA